MKRTCSERIAVLYNEKRREFYARVELVRGEEVADYYHMDKEDVAVMSAARPDLVAYFNDDNLTARGQEIVNAAVAEYNGAHGKKTSVVWLVCDFRTRPSFCQINDRALIAELEQKRGSFTDIGYEGGYDYDEMTAFAKNYSASDEYVVVNCDTCGRYRALKINGDRAVCACGRVFRRSETVFRSKSRAAAIGKASDCNRSGMAADAGDGSEIVPKPFYYKGDVYHFTAADCELLHRLLYADYAFEEIFKGETVSGFTPKYESYLFGLNRNGVRTELYRERNRTLTEIRNRRAGGGDALYYFINKYGMGGSGLRRLRDGVRYEFSSVSEYAEALVNAREEERARLVSLFDGDACNYFFRGYEPTETELSRLVYNATGRFVCFREGTVTDFGKDFMNELAQRDGLEGERGIFLNGIRLNEAFWNSVKGEYTDECEFVTPCADNYGWLCMMQYAVTGRKKLKFGCIEIADSEEGERTVRSIVEAAYKARDARALREYTDLCRLFELGLLERLDALCAVKTKQGRRVIDGLKGLLLPASETPNVEAYLYCARISLGDRSRVTVRYDGRCDSVFAHARRAAENPGIGGGNVKKLIADGDIVAALGFIFDDIEERRQTLKARFKELVREAERLSG